MPLGCRLRVYLCCVLKQTNKRLFWGGLTGDLLSLGTVQALGALLPLATVPYAGGGIRGIWLVQPEFSRDEFWSGLGRFWVYANW